MFLSFTKVRRHMASILAVSPLGEEKVVLFDHTIRDPRPASYRVNYI